MLHFSQKAIKEHLAVNSIGGLDEPLPGISMPG